MATDLEMGKARCGWSKSALAAEFELDRKTVAKVLMDIQPMMMKGNNAIYRMRDVAGPLGDYIRGGTSYEPNSDDFDPTALEPIERKAWYDSEWKRMEVESRKLELLEVADYNAGQTRVFLMLKNFLGMLPDVLELRVNLSPEQVEMAVKACDEQQNEVYRTLIGDRVE